MLYELQNEHWHIGVLPKTGGSLAFGRVRVGETWRDFFRPTPEGDYDNASLCASFVLVPYSNRIRQARFTFQGHTYQLQPNTPEGNAIHGTARRAVWHVTEQMPGTLSIDYDSSEISDTNWIGAVGATQTFSLMDSHLFMGLTITNLSDKPMPAGFGHHPYFQKSLSSSRQANTIFLQLPYDQHIPLDDGCLPIDGYAKPIPPQVDFRVTRPLDDTVADHCLTSRIGDEPIWFVYPETEIALRASPILPHLIFYAPPSKSFFAIEPVSNINDGFNLLEAGVPNTGVFVLQPGETREARLMFSLSVPR
jgi:aldose 1-epimerase